MEVIAYPLYYKIKDDEDGTVKLKVYLYDLRERRFISGYYRRHKPFLVIESGDVERAKKVLKEARFEGVVRIAEDPRKGYHRIYVKSPTLIRRLRGILNAEGIKTYEDDIKYLMRVMIDGVIPARPLKVVLSNVERKEDERGELLRGDIVYVEPLEEEFHIETVPVASFDIEIVHPKEVFPTPRKHPIFLISVAVADGDEMEYYALVNTAAFDDEALRQNAGKTVTYPYRNGEAKVIFFENEQDAILEFGRIIARKRVMVISGYNSDSFDWYFLVERAKQLGIYYDLIRYVSTAFDDEPLREVPYDERDPSFSMIRPQSSKEKTVFVPGRLNVDIFQLIRLPMFKPIVGNITPLTLKNVAAELGVLPTEQRVMIDLATTTIEEEWKQDWKRTLEYNLDDAYAALKLTFSFLPQMVVLSQITNIPIQFIVKWSNSKILTVLFGIESLREGILIPHAPSRAKEIEEEEVSEEILELRKKAGKDVKYRGAFVIHPDPSIVDGLAILDFQSLYPNIIVNFNIGTDSLLGTFVRFEEEDGRLYMVVEDKGKLKRIPFSTKEINVTPFVYHVFRSAQAHESFVRKVVNKMLKNRIAMKHAAKKLKKFEGFLEERSDKPLREVVEEFLENTKFPFGEKPLVEEILGKLLEKYESSREEFVKELKSQAEIMDRKQTAFKFLINSTYGVLGFTNFRWYEKRSAESITAYGRWLIMRTREFLEKVGFHVVSGDTDSVMITLKDNILYHRVSEEAKRAREQYVREYEEAKKFIEETFRPYLEDPDYLLFQPVEKLIPLWREFLVEKLRESGADVKGDEPFEELYRKAKLVDIAIWMGDFCTEYLYKPFTFILEFDKYFDKAIFLMAKNYAAVAKGKLKLKGIEAKKRNFSRIARNEQLFLLTLFFDLFDYFKSLKEGKPDVNLVPDKYAELKSLLTGVRDWDGFIDALLAFLDRRMHRIVKGILNGEYPIEMFVRFTELGKNPDEYDQKGSAGVYAALAEMRDFPEVKYVRGDRIPWVYAMDPDLVGRKKVTKSMFARTVSHVVRKGLKIYPIPYIEEIAGRYDKLLYVFDRYTNPSKFMRLVNGTSMSTLDDFMGGEEIPVTPSRKPTTILDFVQGEPTKPRKRVTLEDYF